MPSSDTFWAATKADLERALPRFLLQQRWYPAKDAGQPAVRARELFPVTGPSLAAVSIWDVVPKGNPLLMFVPVAAVQSADPDQTIATVEWNGASHTIVEAFSNDDFVRAWIAFQLGATESELASRLHRGRTGRPLNIDPACAQIRRSHAEQSNTSIRIGEHAIMKVIRKLESGAHPELEIARFLAKAGFNAIPALLGWVELAAERDHDSYALSLLQEFVPNLGDGWSWTLQQLRRGIISGDQTSLDELAQWLDRLATQTAALHRAFAAATDDPAFHPEPVSAADLARWAKSAEEMANRAFCSMAAAPDEQVRQFATELVQHRKDLHSRICGLKDLPHNFLKTRHHGDFHLGQVLVAGHDAMILDFEGEPLRPLAERRAKHCVLRDVAGAVRSLSYAAASTARSVRTATREQLTALDQWQSRAARAFVTSYFAAAEGLQSIPSGRTEAEALLNFFLLEKALYEVNYEAANRPDWVTIPLQGMMSLLRQERR